MCAEEGAAKNGCKSDGQGAFVDACAGLGEAACVAVDTDGSVDTLDCTFGSALTTIGPQAFEASVRPSVFVGIHAIACDHAWREWARHANTNG